MMKTGHTLLAVSSVDADSENPKLVVTCHYLHIDISGTACADVFTSSFCFSSSAQASLIYRVRKYRLRMRNHLTKMFAPNSKLCISNNGGETET